MARLKSKTKFPPGEFQLLLPEVGMKRQLQGSFYEMVNAFAGIVAKNPGIAQRSGWPTDRAGQEAFVEDREVHRLLSHGWHEFVEFDAQADPPASSFTGVKKNWRSIAAAVVNGGKAAAASYRDMFGERGPVERGVAEKRAEVCAGCPQNDTEGELANYFLSSTANGLMALIGALKDMSVGTAFDDKLGVCKACHCPLRAKVHVRYDVIQSNMPQEVWDKLSREPECWILSENNGQ